jgi:hypothetical protein
MSSDLFLRADRSRNVDADMTNPGIGLCGETHGDSLTRLIQKRLQSLPLRTSPTARRVAGAPSFPPAYPNFSAAPLAPHTITPGDSDSEDATASALNQQSYQHDPQMWADCPELVVAQQPSPTSMHVDQDMEMMDTSDGNSAPAIASREVEVSHQNRLCLQPGPSLPEPVAPSLSGRMPTPIHASFIAQVRGNNWGGAAGNVMAAPTAMAQMNGMAFRTNSDIDVQHMQSMMMGHESVPRSLDGAAATEAVMADWSMVQNRRLPSPISESGGEESLGSPVMVLDSSPSMKNLVHPMISGLPPRANSAMELAQPSSPEHQHRQRPNSSPRDSTPSPEGDVMGPNDDGMDMEPTTPSPLRKGHTRSRHTLNTWTAMQPGMKKSFSIGYRADCEKCRLKVPGHFNHIIIS